MNNFHEKKVEYNKKCIISIIQWIITYLISLDEKNNDTNKYSEHT